MPACAVRSVCTPHLHALPQPCPARWPRCLGAIPWKLFLARLQRLLFPAWLAAGPPCRPPGSFMSRDTYGGTRSRSAT